MSSYLPIPVSSLVITCTVVVKILYNVITHAGITSTVSLPLPSTTTTSGVEGGVSTTVLMPGEETSFKVQRLLFL